MRERIITAICLLAVVLPIIYFGGVWFIGLGLIATAIATIEMMNMYDKAQKMPLVLKGITLISTLSLVFLTDVHIFWQWLIVALCFVSFVLALLIKKIQVATFNFYFVCILAYIGISFRSLLAIRHHSLNLFIFLVISVILTDTMAYFSGRFLGKHKLAPKISPNKTIEGAVGGWLCGALFAYFFGLSQQLFVNQWVLMSLAICLPILSQLGDLLASLFKRKYGIKDYGKLFPGHGGVMDRVDSQLLAAVLIYVMIIFGGLL